MDKIYTLTYTLVLFVLLYNEIWVYLGSVHRAAIRKKPQTKWVTCRASLQYSALLWNLRCWFWCFNADVNRACVVKSAPDQQGSCQKYLLLLKAWKEGSEYRTIKLDHKLPWNINFLWMKWWLLIIEPSSHFLPTQQAYPQRATPHDPKDLLQTSCVHALTGQSATRGTITIIRQVVLMLLIAVQWQ